ncbi:hypothetical protein P7C70_g5827, partial [Phenoliferia sp. Uapishka_3]
MPHQLLLLHLPPPRRPSTSLARGPRSTSSEAELAPRTDDFDRDQRRGLLSSTTTPPTPTTPLGRSVPPSHDATPTTPRLDSATTPQTPITPSASLIPLSRPTSILPTLSEVPEDPSEPPSPTLSSTAQVRTTFPPSSSVDYSDDENMPTGHEEDRLSSLGPVNAGNWKEWREALQGCLEMLGFDKAMDEAMPAAPEGTSGAYSTEMVNYHRALKEWTKDTASTVDIIRRHSGTVNTVYLTKGDTPKKWLTNLKTVYDVENVMDGAFLVEAFLRR